MADDRSGGWAEALSGALEQLRVAETLKDLRVQVEDLVEDLDAPDGAHADGRESEHRPRKLDDQLCALGQKVEVAGDLLANLTDALESQAERLETLETQLGDPDAEADCRLDSELGACRDRLEALTVQLGGLGELQKRALDRADQSVADRALVDELATDTRERLTRFAERTEELERSVAEVRALAAERAARIEELEGSMAGIENASAGRVEELEVALAESERAHAGRIAELEAALAEGEQGRTGRIEELESALGEHARRREELEAELGAHEKGPAVVTGRPGRRPTVLVVGGVSQVRARLCLELSKTGYQVVAAGTAEDCLARLRHHRVDAMLLSRTVADEQGAAIRTALDDDSAYSAQEGLVTVIYGEERGPVRPEEIQGLLAASAARDYVAAAGDTLAVVSALVRHMPAMPSS